MPKLAAFPKAFMDPLCVDGSMTVREWIDLAATLDIDGLEFYSGFLELEDPSNWAGFKSMSGDKGLPIPMLCCSPDFTHPNREFRKQQVDKEKGWIEMSVALGAGYCRILTGQRRPEVSIEDGVSYCEECFGECLDFAKGAGVTLILENHYKDNYWQYPEFAQKKDVFIKVVDRIRHPNFGVNYDPSNTILAGEDPIELLDAVLDRVVTMHASDRYLKEGTLEDLRKEENVEGYAARLSHGEIGKGLNDYDVIFSKLSCAEFDSWISIEDGVDGMRQMERSVKFLRDKIRQHWPEAG
jgi:sugar phosphate isomerase/epimerase